MDIRRWLDETVQPELPLSRSANFGVEVSVHPEKPKAITRGRRGRKRSNSDSSLLDPPTPREKTPTKKRKPPTEGSTDSSAVSETSHATSSQPTESCLSGHRYARRPRRRTHPERYEASSKAVKERGKHAYRSRKGESKKSRRKSKRKKHEKPRTGIVQSFHAKNVSGDRLTLKPREQLGIFNKGKTSMAVKGRGLPDLVFSEMRFLQKHKDQPELSPQAGVTKKQRNNDYAHTKEGEISAFFTSVRPVLAEKDGNTQTREGRPTYDILRETSCRERERSSMVNAAIPTIPTVELPDKASYLGPGSREPRHESTSAASWSESSRAPSRVPAHPRTKPVVYTDQPDSISRGEKRKTANKEDASFKGPETASLARRRSSVTVELFRVSSMAPSLHRKSRSQSYPQHTSSPRRPNLIDRAAKVQSTDTVDSPSSMPPVVPVSASVDAQQARVTDSAKVPRSKATSLSSTKTFSINGQSAQYDEDNDVDANPQTSSDLGRVLQQCNSTFHKQRQVDTPLRRHTVREVPAQTAHKAEPQAGAHLYPTIHRVPTVRFANVETCAPTLPNFPGLSIYEQQSQRQQLPLQPLVETDFLSNSNPLEQDYLNENDGMGYVDQSWEDLPREIECYGVGESSGAYGVNEAVVTGDAARHLALENTVVAPGFWRPNRLY